jgi:hypothetical protein
MESVQVQTHPNPLPPPLLFPPTSASPPPASLSALLGVKICHFGKERWKGTQDDAVAASPPPREGKERRIGRMYMAADEAATAFVATSLDTRIAVSFTASDTTVADLKRTFPPPFLALR